jgi:hypothetical protein
VNPVTKSLKRVLGTAMDSIQIFDYSVAGEFEKLWKFEDLSARILIVWGKAAPDARLWPIDASACLSPLDWAAAYVRHCFPEQAEQAEAPVKVRHWPQIMILDADTTAHASVPTLAHFHTLHEDQLPWLTVPKVPSLKDVCKWLAPTTNQVDQTTQDALTRFLREIRLNLTEVRTKGDYDRHAISNIVAPMALLGRAVIQSLHSAALENLMKVVGICSESSPGNQPTNTNPLRQDAVTKPTGTNSPATTDDCEAEAFVKAETGDGLSVLLVDDQEHHGWTDWLRQSLPKATTVTALRSPIALVEAIKQQMEMAIGSGGKDLRFRFQLPGFVATANPVLFLDLRLFSGNRDAELAFYRDHLLKLIDGYFLDKKGELAWPSFSSAPNSAFSAARLKITNGAFELESPEHHEALTWLPRILALVDMSLPVVIFSSTGRRHIAQKLSQFGNLVVQSSKPRVHEGSGRADWAEEASRDLPISIAKARDLLRGRKRGRQVLATQNLSIPGLNRDLINHFELYIDESLEGSNLIIGGLFAGFASPADAQLFDDRLVEKGVRYFESDTVGPQPPKVKVKTDPCNVEFRDVVAQWRIENRPLLLGLLTLDGIEPFRTPLRFLDMDFMDNRWRLGVEAIVELFLSEVVGKQDPSEELRPPSLAIYAPTRVSPASSLPEARINQAKFGTTVQQLGAKWGNNAVSESNLFPIVGNIIRNHSLNVEMQKAKYIRLQYKPRDCREWETRTGDDALVTSQSPPAPRIPDQLMDVQNDPQAWRAGLKALHYVCDQLLRDLQRSTDAEGGTFGKSSPCLHNAFDKILRGNMAASRFLDTNRLVEAIVAWRPHTFKRPRWRTGVRSASDCIGRRLSSSLPNLTGPQFDVVCRRLRDFASLTSQQPPVPSLRSIPVTCPSTEEPSTAEPADSQDEDDGGVTSRYFVRIDNLNDQISAQGLLEASTVGAAVPLACQLADDAYSDMKSAIIYYPKESDPMKVSTSLRRRGWTVTPFIASPTINFTEPTLPNEEQITPEITNQDSETQPVKWTANLVLRVGPVIDSLDFDKLVHRVKETFNHIRVVNRLRPHKNSRKYIVDFNWPGGASADLGIDSIQCGDELVPVALLNENDNSD